MFNKIKKSLKQNIGSLILPHLPWQLCDFGFSGRVIIEPTNVCNLRCPLCQTPKMKREKGFLSLENFKKIINDISSLKSINFGWAGEPLLNKEIFKMVKYASSRGIRTSVSTNTVFLNNYIDEALSSGLRTLVVCLDGASKETHEKYRIGSDFESIKRNIKELCQEKKKRKLKNPSIVLQSLLTKYSEHEMPEMIKLAESLGVDSLEFKTLSLGSKASLDEKIKRAKEFLPSAEFSRYDFKEGKPVLKSKPKLCSWLRQTVILWNGDITVCCYDMEGDLVIGNIFKDGGFKKVWKSEKYKKYRRKILRTEFSLCKNCSRTDEYSRTIRFHKNK
jgi:radical SAM protein with 4Fe4S-binding SPASM domain